MSFGIDVNVLLDASDESSPLHDQAAEVTKDVPTKGNLADAHLAALLSQHGVTPTAAAGPGERLG